MKLGLLLLLSAVPGMAGYMGAVQVIVQATGTMTGCHGGDAGFCASVLGSPLPGNSFFNPNFTFFADDNRVTGFGSTSLTFDDHDLTLITFNSSAYHDTDTIIHFDVAYSGTVNPDLSMAGTPFVGTMTYFNEAQSAGETWTITGTIRSQSTVQLLTPEPDLLPFFFLSASLAAVARFRQGRARYSARPLDPAPAPAWKPRNYRHRSQ